MNRTNARLLKTRLELTGKTNQPAYTIAHLMCIRNQSFLDAYDRVYDTYKDGGFTTYKSTGATWDDVKHALHTYTGVSA